MGHRKVFSARIALLALGLTIIGAACEAPSGQDSSSQAPASNSAAAAAAGQGAQIASFGTIPKQVLNLAVSQSVSVTATASSQFSGKVTLAADTTTLRLSDPSSKVSITFSPAMIDLTNAKTASFTVTVAVDPAAPALDSTFNIVATAAGSATGTAIQSVALQVKAVYEIDLSGPPAKGPAAPETFSGPSAVSFATHPEGILIRFVNLDTRQAHEIHSSGSPIPHEGTTAANQSSTGVQPGTLAAATASAQGGVYQYMVTTQSKVTDTYYCHLHESGTNAKTLTFNAYAAPPPVVTTTNPNATFTYINTNVFQPKCVSCHGTAGGYSFANYTNAVKSVTVGEPSISALYLSVAPGGSMPQGAPALSASDVQAISDWITSGAPNN